MSFFDLRVDSPHKDLVVIQGNENESDPVPFSGKVKLSINENLHVKTVRLSLIGEIKIIFSQKDEHGAVVNQVYEQLCVLKVNWENLLTSDEGRVVVGSYGEQPVKTHKLNKKLEHVKAKAPVRPGLGRAASESNLEDISLKGSTIKVPESGLDGTPFRSSTQSSNHTYLLPKGNYSLPFQVFLPANVSESVEGLSVAKLLYRLECKIKRGRFEKPLEKAKHVRIVRTLKPTDLNLTDNVDIANQWPGKVDYRVLVNKKGIAVGQTVPIRVVMVPLVKGLSVQKIKAEIAQHYHCGYLEGSSPEYEQILGHQNLLDTADMDISSDKWDIVCHFKVPQHLGEITQSCKLKYDLIEVKHRIRLIIHLRNSTGHVSELRANIPFHLYVSTNVGHAYGYHIDVDPMYHTFNPNKSVLNPLFKKDKYASPSESPSRIQEEEEDSDLDRQQSAPPLYENSKFDKMYDISSPKSPLEQLNDFSITSYFDIPQGARSKQNSGHSTPLNLNALSRVPSYGEAIDEEAESAMAPSYEKRLQSLSMDNFLKYKK